MPVVIAMTNTACIAGKFCMVAKVLIFCRQSKKKNKKTLLLWKSCRQYNIVSTDTKIKLQKFAPAKIP